MEKIQVAIVGAGPAGLAAALTLSRSMIRPVIFDTVDPARNAASPFVAALPGFDKNPPSHVRRAIRNDIASYPYAVFESQGISAIQRNTEGFTLTRDDGSRLSAEKVLLATGMVDLLPDLGGLAECWGHSVINCPFCHGIEWHNKRWGIYAHRPEVIDAAEIYANWSQDLTYFLDPALSISTERRQKILTLGADIVDGLPHMLHSQDGKLTKAELSCGRLVSLDCLLVFPHQRQTEVVRSLGLSMTDAGYVNVDVGYRTSLPHLYAAGDLTYAGHQNTPTALHMGNMAAATIVMDHCFGK